MDEQAKFTLALYAAQSVATLLLALLFLYYGRIQSQPYLMRWSLAWAALTTYTVLAGFTLLLVITGARDSWLRHLGSGGSLAALYIGMAMFLLGGWEAARRVRPSDHATRILVVTALVLGVGSVLVTTLPGTTSEVLMLVRFGLRCLVEGAVFGYVAWVIWRVRRGRAMGIRFTAGAFGIYGGFLLLQFLALLGKLMFGQWLFQATPYFGLIEFLMLMLIAVGLTLWLHEEEHDRLETAHGEIAHLISHDSLTGLPNRRTLIDVMRTFLDSAHGSTGVLVAYFNLDRFRRIAESQGRFAADAVLRRVGDRLTLTVGAEGVASRVGDDEFVVVLRNVGSRADGTRRIGELHRTTTEPIEVAGTMLVCPMSVGTSFARDAVRDPEVLLHEAETAMRVAKEAGGDRVLEYHDDQRHAPRDDLALELELRGALDSGALVIHLQPVVDARSGALLSAEALVRWPHPERGMVPPIEFLPLAIRAGLIERIDEGTLRQAVHHIGALRRSTGVTPGIAVNLSTASLMRADLLDLVGDVCAEEDLPTSALTFEVTEHDVVGDFERGRRRIAALREMGFGIVIDDFGTGYSSMRYLAQLPITGIKIDRSFVERIADDARAHGLVKALVGMAQNLQLGVVAEGVEDARQAASLIAMGCLQQQGFHFHRPMSPAAFAALVSATH